MCAESVLLGAEIFSAAGETVVIPDREIRRRHLEDADALIVRSKTPVTGELLDSTPVKFVGTATAGTDHIDTQALADAGIYWCSAPGCNAESVAEYVTAALLTLARESGEPLKGKSIAIIGWGNVGRRVEMKARALGLQVLRNDPPLEAAGGGPEFMPLETCIEAADIVSLHVPLTREGRWPTAGLASYHFFEHFRPGTTFINTSRGEVCDLDALIEARAAGLVARAVLDVWDPEPAFRLDALAAADLATPHIAGHSFEGKLNGTLACYRELCRFFEIEPRPPAEEKLPPAPLLRVDIDDPSVPDEALLHRFVRSVYDIRRDDRALREAAVTDGTERGRRFEALRRNYPLRREFSAARVVLPASRTPLGVQLRGLGFRVEIG